MVELTLRVGYMSLFLSTWSSLAGSFADIPKPRRSSLLLRVLLSDSASRCFAKICGQQRQVSRSAYFYKHIARPDPWPQPAGALLGQLQTL